MQNNFEPIDPSKVIVDTEPELIDPRKVVIHPAMSAADRRRVYNSFSGDPLAFIADEGERLYLRHVTEQLPDRDEYRKRMALAAYFTHENKGSDFSFNMHNLDGILESFYRRKISVDEAYSDFQKMHGVEKGSMLKELPGVLKENLMEDLAALGAGSLELASTLAATYLKVAKWGSDLQASILSPLMSEEQKKMAFRYGKLLENIGQEVAVKENRRIIQKLDKASNANPEFVTDLFTGDFDQVSARDFTKALARSAPSMAFQILAGAAAGPWLLPTIIGTQTVAMKDYEVNDKHPEWDGSKKWSYIGLSAANEALFEIVTSKIVGGKMSREAGAKLIQQGLLKYMGKSFAKEGGSEGAQQLLSNITDLVYDIDGNRNQLNGMQLLARVFAGVPEAGFIGGVWGFPEGVTGYFSARRVAGIVNDIRVKHEKSATELSAKDELSDAEAAQLEVSRKILEAGTPQEMLALDHINDTLKKVQEDEDIQNSPTYRDIEKTAAYATSNEELVAAVKAERKNSFDVTATWNVADVADAVTDISKIFKDTVFHVVDNWQNVADIPNLDVRKRAAYNIETGEVYINAAAVRPHEVPQIILHEVVGHKGLRSVLKGADLDSVLDQVYRDHCQEQSFKDIAAKYFKPVELVDEDGVPYLDISLDKIGDQRLAAEEYIAHIAETKVKPKWWKEVLQKVRMAFAKVFGKEFRMSDNQIETLLARASRKVRRNRFGRESSVVTVNTATDKQNLDVDGQDGLRFAALRKQGDPNNAEQKGKLVDGHVPHADGFMEWAGLKGKSLYADYEFLYSRHYRYFKNPQETRAAVELVLAKPEQVADIKGNISFVGFDEVTGDIYRIEINPDIKGQANHIRSIFKITASNYNEIKLEQPRVLQPSKTALHKGGSATMTISNFIDNISQFSENASAEEFRFSIADFSEEQQRNIMDILSPFVGDVVERDREEYADYLASRGVKNVSPDDAFHFALEIVRRKHLTALAARRAKRDNWLYDNILEYKWAVDFSGSSSFQIKLSPRFRGKDTSGTFWLGKKDKGTPVINLDELARYVADEIGGNELDIEQQLFDFYNDLTWVELRKEYTKYRKEMIAADRDADRQAKEEFLEQEKFRIQDEIVQIFSDGKPVVNEQWINENRDVFKELYKKIFPDRNPPYTPSQADIEAINMALVQESGNADVYAQAFKDAKEKAWQQYSGKLKELREKVLSSMTDAVRLQREAVAFAQKNLPKANQSEFVRNIVGLLEYSNAPSARFPEGRRKTEFDKIIARMTERAAEVRKTELLDKIAKRLQQLGERTDSGRRVRGMRDIDTQRRLNRIIAISRLDAGSLNMAITENQKKIEELLSLGADTSELEYDIALLNRYGTLWNKSAGEVNTAFEHLQMLARSGKDNLLAEINKRAADDEYDRNELWRAVNGGRRYNDIEQKTLADKNTKSARAKKNLDKTFWQSLSFDGMLEAMALFANDENVVNRFRQMAHEAKLAKDVLNSSNSDDCHEFLKKLLKTKSPFTIAEKIGKWREIQVQTGVKRFVPDPDARQFEYERLSVDQARVMLQNYDAGKKNMPDYEAEAIRQQLSTLDRKIKYDVPEEFRDGATDQLMKIIRAENEGSKEPVVIIPRQTFNGASQEVPLTQMQALYLKLMWDQKDIRFKMHYNGYTQETMQQIDKFLLPEVKAFGAWMRSQLEADRSRIEEVYRQMYFAEFPKEDNYFPAVYKVSGNNVNGQSVDIAQPGSAAGAVAYTPGALKVRVYHLKAIRSDTDALTVFQNHRLMMNHFVTHAAAARKMRSVLLSSDVKNAIESEHGIVAYQELKTALQDFINGGNIDVDVNSMVSKIYGNAVRSKMAANVISGIKQTMGAISYLQEIPPDALAKGMAYAAAHPKEVWRTLGNTDYFRIRWNSGANADLRLLLDASGRDASMASVFFDAVDNISTLPLRLGDAASVLFGGFAVYKYHYDNLVKFGMDHAQARREALQKWEMATERTQQSSAPFLLNKFQRGGAESRIFTTFTSNQILLWNNYASAIYKSVHYGKTAPLKKAVRGIAALILSSAAMTVFDQMKEHYKDDKYQWGELFFNVLADAVTGFGPFGRIASEVISAAKPDGFMPSNFWSSDIIMGYYAVERQLGKNKKISDNAYVDAVRLLQAAGYFLKPAAQAGAIAREARKIYKISNEK